MHGKFVLHPFLDRRIPIITDGELVDMSFGKPFIQLQEALVLTINDRLWRGEDHARARPERFCIRKTSFAAEHQHIHGGWQDQ